MLHKLCKQNSPLVLLSSVGAPIPPVLLGDWESGNLAGLRIGVDDELNQVSESFCLTALHY